MNVAEYTYYLVKQIPHGNELQKLLETKDMQERLASI